MKVVVISGYFNPLHIGHLDYIENAKKLGDYLIAIINSDRQVIIKGSRPFMGEQERKRIVSSIGDVNEAVVSIDTDASVVKTLSSIWNKYSIGPFFDHMIFANGGDRKEGEAPETNLCKELGILEVYGVGGEKTESSSNLLKFKSAISKTRGM
jgi:D-beta-D-heptose 7-phosphate kinase/D-beta-D-heptose 1-phosphate adenosyltransferase